MVPTRGRPSIAPTLQHLDDVRNPILPEDAPASLQENRVLEVKSEGMEQIDEPLHDGIIQTITKSVGSQLIIDSFLNLHTIRRIWAFVFCQQNTDLGIRIL